MTRRERFRGIVLIVVVSCGTCICVVASCGAGICGAEDAPATLSPHWGNIEGTWLFRTDPMEVGEKEGWEKPGLAEDEWRTLEVPGYWEAQGVTDPRPGQAPKPKGRLPWTDYDGAAWYRLHFAPPKEWAGQEMILLLGSVDDYDRTFINGRLVGETGPGVKEAVSVKRAYRVPAEAVRFGGENVLAIRVFDGGGPGGLMGTAMSLLPKAIAEAPMTLPQSDRPLPERFDDPPAASRIIKIVHSLPDEPEAQDSLIRSLISQGFGGVVCNVSFNDYLESEEKWQAFVRGVKEAKRAGMSLWLYDEHGYPSGTAGGITLRGRPEWEARGLLIAEATSSGGRVELELPPGELFLASAFPQGERGIDAGKAVDLRANARDGKLVWQAPEGRWRVMAISQDRLYEGTHAAVSLADKLPYVNLLMPEPTARFIELTHQAYAKHLGDDLGQWFVSTFTDEPSLMSLFMRPMPYRVLPWAPELPEEFERRRGYALRPVIPMLIADAGGAEKRARYDFWLTVGELVSENYFGQIQQWCREHDVASGGHLLMEESFVSHVPLYGDFFRCLRRLDAPSMDCLTSIPAQVPWSVARLISSAADLEGRTVTMCETSDFAQRYRPEGDKRPVRDVSEAEIRGTCNRLMLGGITTITSYYSFNGLSTSQLRRLNEHVGRCSTMLAGGHQATDIAVLYPIESAWPRFRPARHGATDSPTAPEVEAAFDAATQALYSARRDFTYVDSRALSEAKVEGGALAHGDLRWRVVVLPCADTLPMAAWENLARFWREGGVVIALAARPENSASEFPSERVKALGREMFGDGDGARVVANDAGGAGVFLPRGSEAMLPVALDALIEPDFSASGPTSALRATHRRIDGHEVYFVINDGGAPCEETVALAVEGEGELWDPATGEMKRLASGDEVKLSLEPYGGVLLRFPAARTPRRREVKSGRLPGLSFRPVPGTRPSLSKGEFVEGSLSADEPRSGDDAPAWRAVGTLTKGDVDTFLFVSFNYAKAIDLSDAHSLVLDTWVPDGQRTPAQLLVIIRDADGADYLAQTGRALSAAGRAQSFIPLSSFEIAGWSKDANGRLDLARVAAISVGWGGYFGKKGEVVEFTLALPKAGKLAR